MYKYNFKKYEEDHEKKIEEYTVKKKECVSNIYKNVFKLFPKPNKRHRYCGVCKANYDEYIEHI